MKSMKGGASGKGGAGSTKNTASSPTPNGAPSRKSTSKGPYAPK